MYSQEAIAQDGAPQGESAPADSADHDAGQNTAPVEVQDDVSLISIILLALEFLSKQSESQRYVITVFPSVHDI